MEDNVLRDKSDGFALRVIETYLKNKFQPLESLELLEQFNGLSGFLNS